ncbi:hypothetical protein [Corynebacterium sp. H130]|uniref:hypothetical protein n=1 Tax=Corynebacterium sp. H130 TaxID=3133444 RepID=UPI0030B75D05
MERNLQIFSTFRVAEHKLQVAPVAVAAVDCLQSIYQTSHSWWVPRIPKLAFKEVRAVQVIDATRRCFSLTFHELQAQAHNRFDSSLLRRLWQISDPGADSPHESSLRLTVQDLAEWESQVELCDIFENRVTVADLADHESKVALFYDGVHHLDRKQRDLDTSINQKLLQVGWTPVRITAGQLRNPLQLRSTIQTLIRSRR